MTCSFSHKYRIDLIKFQLERQVEIIKILISTYNIRMEKLSSVTPAHTSLQIYSQIKLIN